MSVQLTEAIATSGKPQPLPAPRRPVTRTQLSRWAITLEAPYSWIIRLHLHLLIGAIPVLAISGEAFGLVTLQAVAVRVLVPLIAITTVVVIRRPDRSDRLILSSFLWGIPARGCYDAFRLPTIYVAHWWQDFFVTVGGWATAT